MKKLNRVISAALICALSICALTACGGGDSEGGEAAGGPGGAGGGMQMGASAISVSVKDVSYESIEEYTNVSSKIESISEISVVPKVGGTVKSVNVGLGDYVKAGDVLFVIDDTDSLISVAQAQASLSSAQASVELSSGSSLDNTIYQSEQNIESLQIQYDDLVKSLNNTKELQAIGGASQSDVDDLQSSVDKLAIEIATATSSLDNTVNSVYGATKDSSSAQLLQAQKSLESAQLQLERTQVVAEFDGVISSVDISVGTTVSTGTSAMTLVSMDGVKLTFNISDSAINRVEVGTDVYVTVSSVSDEAFKANVTSVSPVADSSSLLYPIEVVLDNEDGLLKAGMFASAKVVLDTVENTIAVPLNSVIQKSGEIYVFVVDEATNTAVKTLVTLGVENEENIEIVDGVEPGDKVIISGQDYVSDGTLVNIIE